MKYQSFDNALVEYGNNYDKNKVKECPAVCCYWSLIVGISSFIVGIVMWCFIKYH